MSDFDTGDLLAFWFVPTVRVGFLHWFLINHDCSLTLTKSVKIKLWSLLNTDQVIFVSEFKCKIYDIFRAVFRYVDKTLSAFLKFVNVKSRDIFRETSGQFSARSVVTKKLIFLTSWIISNWYFRVIRWDSNIFIYLFILHSFKFSLLSLQTFICFITVNCNRAEPFLRMYECIYIHAIRDVATVLYWSCLFNEKHNKELFFALVIDGALHLGFSYL